MRISILFLATLALASLPVHAAFPRPTLAKNAIVTSPHDQATQAGLQILNKGGNAIDAAVATAFAIGVTLPYSAGIGGGGFALIRNKEGKIEALDFREKAPALASRDMFVDKEGNLTKDSINGPLSVAVPGTVAGLFELHQKYGKLKWAQVIEPARVLAARGFEVSELYSKFVTWRKDVLSQYPESRKTFFKREKKGGATTWRAYERGERLVQKDLAQTLARIQRNPRDFYTGRTAKKIVRDLRRQGGLVTLEDLASYSPTWRDPLCGNYRGHEVCSMPPPSSGGVHIIQILNMLESTDMKSLGWHSPAALHLMIETMRTAFAERAVHLGDPAFVEVPVAELTSKAYATKKRGEISLKKARASKDVVASTGKELKPFAPKESNDTSHLTTADAEGNVVALTFTVNYGFGSGVVAKGTGVLLNDEMDDFAGAPGKPNAYGLVGGKANSVAGGKIPLSSMSPLIAEKEGAFAFACGSPGGSTIITTSLQIALNIIDHDFDAAAAVAAPRLHHQWLPDEVRLEPWGFDPATYKALRAMGHTLVEKGPWGNASAIIRLDDGTLAGAADPRGEGSAKGR